MAKHNLIILAIGIGILTSCETRGSYEGVVYDSDESGPLDSVRVELWNNSFSGHLSDTTDSDGQYRIAHLNFVIEDPFIVTNRPGYEIDTVQVIGSAQGSHMVDLFLDKDILIGN